MFIGQFGGPATIFKHGAGRFCPNIKKPTKPQGLNSLVRAEKIQSLKPATPLNPVTPIPGDPKGGKHALECKRFHTKEEGMRSASKCHPYDFQVLKFTCVVGFFWENYAQHCKSLPPLQFYAKCGNSRQNKGCF